MDDVIRRLGTDEVPRLRVGIGAPPLDEMYRVTLSRFPPDEQAAAEESIQRKQPPKAEAWVEKGLSANQYNA